MAAEGMSGLSRPALFTLGILNNYACGRFLLSKSKMLGLRHPLDGVPGTGNWLLFRTKMRAWGQAIF